MSATFQPQNQVQSWCMARSTMFIQNYPVWIRFILEEMLAIFTGQTLSKPATDVNGQRMIQISQEKKGLYFMIFAVLK